ncbi:Asp23/Gls24 family envelope stress response protein [Streptomyces sp. 5-8]|uniref:Asp23/Gls24 family envelope stress response protein n=1 Tax=Streptomyces musisoli TaxID=2802280 RepID=A0ABS1P1W5_9ACTN|nr:MULTISPECIES: Asp23/Gls24 family envelope stress response protein [Streptomyces]MBL1106362.1 Asp23/Gls24 family envelope stress response protein [Streptomyces musisoli]MBY8846392.1 Asp23/Gls24 family envelope stress response protein [Streptomyces sp. SP2-10]
MTRVSADTGTLRPSPARVPPAERGATRIADRVVAKIAAQAAREVLAPLPGPAAPPHATVAVLHDAARIRVHIELAYPCAIGARCAAVRRQVTERVGTLAGMEVREVAVDVERLHPAAGPGRTA